MIFVRFLDLDWILVNLPVKSLGSNMSNEREAIRSRTIPSCPPFFGFWSWHWLRGWPLQWSEAPLSAPRLTVLFTSSWDMSPVSALRATGAQFPSGSLIKISGPPLSYQSDTTWWFNSRLRRKKKKTQKSLVPEKEQFGEKILTSVKFSPKILVFIFFISFSACWYSVSPPKVSSLYVDFIQSRDSELIALLLRTHSSPESSGSPLSSTFLTLLLKIKKNKHKLLCLTLFDRLLYLL